MNVLVLIRKLDQTPLEREIRTGGPHGEIITFYNETNNDLTLNVDEVEYFKVVQVCIIYKEDQYYIYIQHGENPNYIKLNIDSIGEIGCFSSI